MTAIFILKGKKIKTQDYDNLSEMPKKGESIEIQGYTYKILDFFIIENMVIYIIQELQ